MSKLQPNEKHYGLRLLQNIILEVSLNSTEDLAKHVCGFLDNELLSYSDYMCTTKGNVETLSDRCVKRNTDGIAESSIYSVDIYRGLSQLKPQVFHLGWI